MKKEYLFVTITGIFSGLIIFLGKILSNYGLSLFELATLPYILSLIFLLPFLFINKKYKIKSSDLKILIIYGILSGLLVLSQFGAVILGAPVAVIVLLLYTQPLWTILISRIFLKEKANKLTLLACLFVLLGIIILVNPFGKETFRIDLGFLVALFGGLMLSLWVIMGRVSSTKGINPIAIKYGEVLFMILFLVAVYPFLLLLVKNPQVTSFSFSFPLAAWGFILMFNLLTQTIGHVLFYKGLKKVSASDAGIILLLEPVSAAILAAIFLNESITTNIIFGGVLILIANYLIIKKGAFKKQQVDSLEQAR